MALAGWSNGRSGRLRALCIGGAQSARKGVDLLQLYGVTAKTDGDHGLARIGRKRVKMQAHGASPWARGGPRVRFAARLGQCPRPRAGLCKVAASWVGAVGRVGWRRTGWAFLPAAPPGPAGQLAPSTKSGVARRPGGASSRAHCRVPTDTIRLAERWLEQCPTLRRALACLGSSRHPACTWRRTGRPTGC